MSAVIKLKLAAIAALLFNGMYRLYDCLPRRNEILFVTRQSNVPSADYRALGDAFSKHGYRCVFLAKHFSRRSAMSYGMMVLREIYYLARCRVCVIDRYDPVVCMIDFKTQSVFVDDRENWVRFREVPVEPVIIQLWHAFGAFKKFGYQSVNTAEGHGLPEMEVFKIHRNYSWIICSGTGARKPFAEAFGYSMSRVLPIGRPEYRLLKTMASQKANRKTDTCVLRQRLRVLFAPTVHKYDKTIYPLIELHDQRDGLLDPAYFEELWTLHPLEVGAETSRSIPALLQQADCVITDYSSIVYEARLLNKPVFFYVPDLDHYLEAPGLNINPLELVPELCAQDLTRLRVLLDHLHANSSSYPWQALDLFVGDAFAGAADDPAETLYSIVGLTGASGNSA